MNERERAERQKRIDIWCLDWTNRHLGDYATGALLAEAQREVSQEIGGTVIVCVCPVEPELFASKVQTFALIGYDVESDLERRMQRLEMLVELALVFSVDAQKPLVSADDINERTRRQNEMIKAMTRMLVEMSAERAARFAVKVEEVPR